MRVRIYQPARTAMQSGQAKTQQWLLEPEIETARRAEPLMGWIAADDTLTELQRRLFFPTRDEAVAFATRKGWDYTLSPPLRRVVRPRNYLDNFRWQRPGDDDPAAKRKTP